MFEYIDMILAIILAFIFGGICALFSYLLDYCFWDGSIFERYIPWLAGKLLKSFYPSEYNELNRGNKEARETAIIGAANKVFLYKVLGGCAICTNVWIANISYVFINLLLDLGWWYMIVYVVSSSFVLRKIMKI